jgi:hypothetical protein
MSLGEYRDASSFSRQRTNLIFEVLAALGRDLSCLWHRGKRARIVLHSATGPRTRSCQPKPNNCGVP